MASCAAADTQITLKNFDAAEEQIYVAVEGQTPKATFTAVRKGLSCNDELPVRVDYQLLSGTTGPPRLTIEGENQGSLTLQAPPRSGTGSGFEASRAFNVAADPGSGDVQHATLRLQNVGQSGLDQVRLGNPSEAPVFVVDDDPTSTPFGFGRSSYRRQESFTLGIPVFRSGSVDAPSSVAFAVSGSGANPAETNDYEVQTPSDLQFDVGERVRVIEIEMLEGIDSDSEEQLTVSLEGQVSPQMSTTDVTIENLNRGSGALRPTGALHHPKHRYKYPQNYPWLNEIHIFTSSADRELTVTRAAMSIVKKLKNDSCRWWTGTGFVKDKCINRRWFTEGIKHPAKDYFLHRLKQRLPVSVGRKTNVAYYEIRASWRDNRGNVSSLRVGKNQNRFDVLRPTLACKNSPFNPRKCKPVRP